MGCPPSLITLASQTHLLALLPRFATASTHFLPYVDSRCQQSRAKWSQCAFFIASITSLSVHFLLLLILFVSPCLILQGVDVVLNLFVNTSCSIYGSNFHAALEACTLHGYCHFKIMQQKLGLL